MNQAYFVEKLAIERQNSFLKEAEGHRAARQIKKVPRVQANQLKRKVTRFVGLLLTSKTVRRSVFYLHG